jgi:uncharacterized membrane protein
VFFGTLALVAAPAALFVGKGGRWHRRFGYSYVLTMAIVLFSAGFLWQAKGHVFLLPLAAVSAYLIFNGTRAIARNRRRIPDPFEDRVDILAAGVAVAAAFGIAFLAATAETPLMLSIRPALVGIAAIAIAFASNDVLGLAAPRMKHGWLLSHFSAMLGSYVSAVTAFIVINAHDVPMMVRWIVPSLAGGSVIVAYTLRFVRLGLPRPAGRETSRQPGSNGYSTTSSFDSTVDSRRSQRAGTPGS